MSQLAVFDDIGTYSLTFKDIYQLIHQDTLGINHQQNRKVQAVNTS